MNLGYDFSSLTGIPGMVGGGVVGNSSWVPPAKPYENYVKRIKVFDFEEGKEKNHYFRCLIKVIDNFDIT